MAELRDVLNEVERLLDGDPLLRDALGRAPRLSPRELARAIRDQVRTFARAVRWEVRVRGQHRTSGLSNEALFEVRAREGRDFLMRTVQLDQHVARELAEAFEGFERLPTLDEMKQVHSRAVLRFIVNERFARGGGDIRLTPLTPAYAKRKREAGKGSRPIGEWSGRHKKSLLNHGFLVYR